MISKKLGGTNMEKKKCDEFYFTEDKRIYLALYYIIKFKSEIIFSIF